MYYSAIGLLAAAVLLIENQDILLHFSEAFQKPAWKAYKRFLIAVLVYYATDIIWGILESRKLSQALFADTSVYFVAMAVGIVFWTNYVVTYLDEKTVFERFLRYAGQAVAILAAVMTVVNIFYPVLFTVDADCVYHARSFRYVILICQIVLLVLISAYAFYSLIRRNKARELRQKYRTLGGFGLIMAVCMILQLQFPYLPLYAIACLLGTCLLRAFVIGDEKEEYRNGMKEIARVTELKQSITSLLDNMPVMTFSKDVETRVYLACNQAFADYAHKETPEGVVGLTDFEIFDAATANHFIDDDRIALSMNKPYVLYENVPDAAGNPRRFQTTKLPFYDANGRKCLLGMSMDVTEMEKAKAAYQNVLKTNTIYENIVEALSGDYFNLYYVDLRTNDYIEYGFRTEEGHQATESFGTNFFAASRQNAMSLIYEDDRQLFVDAMDKENLIKEIRKNGTFIMQYRLMINNVPTYVNLKATRAGNDKRHLIIGVNNIDAQMRDRAAALKASQDRKAYLRLTALSGNLIVLYFVDPETNNYTEFSSTEDYEKMGFAKKGSDFFRTTYRDSLRAIHPEDQDRFHQLMTRENVLQTIEQDGIFVIDYRFLIGGRSVYVRLKAARVEEEEKQMLIIGVFDEDAQIRREQGYVHDLTVARKMATIDALTGAKNKHAYVQWEENINADIDIGEQGPFAVVVCDINNMKDVNDLYGHDEGDACIRRACGRICSVFKHSPVFRVGGDEFAALLMGEDYNVRDELLRRINFLPKDLSSVRPGETISAGMADFRKGHHVSLLSVFKEADMAMYRRKQSLKNALTE